MKGTNVVIVYFMNSTAYVQFSLQVQDHYIIQDEYKRINDSSRYRLSLSTSPGHEWLLILLQGLIWTSELAAVRER